MVRNELLPLTGSFFIGCNYWASHAGTAMWSDWRPEQVDVDLRRLSEAGIEVIRVFPLWPDFQPIDNMYTGEGLHYGYRIGEARLPDTAAGRAGMSQVMLDQFAQFTEIADRYGLKIIVGLITGWMSGRLFVPNALKGKPILSDHDSIRWQVRFVKHFIHEFRASSTIIAWDLGNECNVMENVGSREDAYVWTASIANAIKASDPSRPLISGMHSLSPAGKWTMQDQGELTDILTTHPYPFWTEYMDYDPINTIRPTIHATVESLFYGQIGEKPCFAEEMGTMGPMVCSEEVAADFARASMFSQWAHGLNGLLWWCANDQTKLQHAPYDWVACEGELGLMTEDGRVKPALQELGRIKNVIRNLPIDGKLPARRVDGICILNSEQDHWSTALGAFLLSKQAGFDIDFRYEEQPLPDADFYLLPCVTGVNGIAKQRWEQLLAKVAAGATLYISSNNGYMLNFAELTGLRVQNRSRRDAAAEIVLDGPGTTTNLKIPSQFKLEYKNERAEVLAVEHDGNPALVKSSYGKGTVYYCSLPVELAIAQQPGIANKPDKAPYWRMYEAISREARNGRIIAVDAPNVGITEHSADDCMRYAVAINYSEAPQSVTMTVQSEWEITEAMYGSMPVGAKGTYTAWLPSNEAMILKLARRQV
jgi:hypothetical protein